MACKHTLCQFCLKKWVATSAAHGAFKCPIGGACPNVPRLVPSVNMQIRDVVEARFPDRLQERRQELSAEQSEFGKSLCTQRLQEELDASYVEKRAMDEDLLESLLKAGADVNVRSIKFSDDTLLKVVLNSKHLSAETVYECAELLMNYGATLGPGDKSLCTQRLQEEIDASYVEKRAMDEDLVESLLKAGAEVNVRSIKFSDDTLLKVMLNSTHNSAETVYACAELLMNYGATL